jgi:hypothetical protein
MRERFVLAHLFAQDFKPVCEVMFHLLPCADHVGIDFQIVSHPPRIAE